MVKVEGVNYGDVREWNYRTTPRITTHAKGAAGQDEAGKLEQLRIAVKRELWHFRFLPVDGALSLALAEGKVSVTSELRTHDARVVRRAEEIIHACVRLMEEYGKAYPHFDFSASMLQDVTLTSAAL